MERSETQQLPNTDPTSIGANNWPNRNWNSIDWGSFDYYNWGTPMIFWGNLPETQEKGKQKGGNIKPDGQVRIPPDQIRRGKLTLGVNGLYKRMEVQ